MKTFDPPAASRALSAQPMIARPVPVFSAVVAILSKSLVVVAILTLAVGCSGGSGIDPQPVDNEVPGWHEGTIGHDGLDRLFRYYVPDGVAGDRPVVLLLHGGTRSMDVLFGPRGGGTQEWVQIADEEGALLVVPNGTNAETGSPAGDDQNWNDCRPDDGATGITTADDVGFITSLLDWMEDHFDGQDLRPDPMRVLATGASNGGLMTYRLATEAPGRLAAAAAFTANHPDPSECPDAAAPVPMLIVNGTRDRLMPFDGGTVGADRGTVRSSDETRDYWVGVNGAVPSAPTVVELPDIDPDDGGTILCETHAPAGPAGARVRYCRVQGGGHAMPTIEHPILGRQNHDAEGARLAWAFFAGE